MAFKISGILAVPGEFHYGDKVEVKTAAELKAAAERQPILFLTYGHPAGGIPKSTDFLGTVSQHWDEEHQRVNGDFWFFNERISPSLRMRLEAGEKIPISAGFLVDDVVNGEQKGIFYTHVAVLRDEEDPKCPLSKCGVNVRMESKDNIRFEQETQIEPTPVVKKTEPKTFSAEQIEQIRGLLKDLVPPSPPKVEEPKKLETPKDIIGPAPKGEPTILIPAGASVVPKEWETDADGVIRFIPSKKKEKT